MSSSSIYFRVVTSVYIASDQILQTIQYWRWEQPGNEATSTPLYQWWCKTQACYLHTPWLAHPEGRSASRLNEVQSVSSFTSFLMSGWEMGGKCFTYKLQLLWSSIPHLHIPFGISLIGLFLIFKHTSSWSCRTSDGNTFIGTSKRDCLSTCTELLSNCACINLPQN